MTTNTEDSMAAGTGEMTTAVTLGEPVVALLDKSYDSMGSQEIEEPHYNIDSDGEPPQDEVGDKLTVIHKRQVVKEILETGENLGKPGRPFIVTIQLKGYFAKPETRDERKVKMQAIKEKNRAAVRIIKKDKKKKPPKKKFAEDDDGEASQSSGEEESDEAEDRSEGEGASDKDDVQPGAAAEDAEEVKKAADDGEEKKEEEETKDEEESKEDKPKKKQTIFDEDIGGIEINVIGEDGEVKQGKTFEQNRHMARGTRRPGIRTDRKIYGDDQIEPGDVFLDKQEPFQMALGDPKVPYGLWRAIEHMRQGEKARVMVKAAYGYAHTDTAGVVEYPEGWTEDERKKQLQTRRTFYEIKLHSWIIRHDLLGEGSLLKTIHKQG